MLLAEKSVSRLSPTWKGQNKEAVMTEKEVVVRYIRFCRQGRIPRVLYNAATKDLLIYSVADPRSSLNEEAEKKGYADISVYVWAYTQFGDILTAIRTAIVLYETDIGKNKIHLKAVTRLLAETAKYNPMLTDYDAGAVHVETRYGKNAAREEYDELEGKFWKENENAAQVIPWETDRSAR